MPLGARCRLRRCAAYLGAPAAALLWVTPSRAEPCRVELSGQDHAEWKDAADAIAATEPEGGDCASFRIEIAERGARVTFTTRDGRRAERDVESPAELRPTVEALRETGALGEAPAEAPKPRARKPAEPAVADDDEAARNLDGAAAPAAPDSGAIFALQAGTRGGASDLVSPVLAGSASLALDRWELGVAAAIDFQYFEARSNVRQAPSSGIGAGVTVGRREPLGSVALLAGGRLLIVGLNDEREDDGGERGAGEVRTGAYFGLVLPRTARTRLRADLGFDVVPHDLGGSAGLANARPMTPWWAISALLGVEIGGS